MSLSLVGPPLLRLLAAAWPAPFLHTTTSKFKEVDAARGHSSWTPNHLPLYTSKQRHGQDWIWWPSSSVIRFAESSDGRRLQTVRQQLTPSNDNRTTRRISPVLSFILKFRIPLKSKDRHRNSSTRRSFWNYMTGSRCKRRRLPDPVVRRVSARQKFYRRDRCHAERNLLRIRNLAISRLLWLKAYDFTISTSNPLYFSFNRSRRITNIDEGERTSMYSFN